MYCMNCGVRLAESERCCPLCGTAAYHPDLPPQNGAPPFPTTLPQKEQWNPRGVLFLITLALAAAAGALVICNLELDGRITFAGYTVGGMLLGYCLAVLPCWFARPNPVVFVPLDFTALLLYLLYIDLKGPGGWFMPFAFPVVGGIGLMVTATVTLYRYLRRGALYITGGAFVALGSFMLLVSFLADYTFGLHSFWWAICLLILLCSLGVFLLLAAMIRPLREALHKCFFL